MRCKGARCKCSLVGGIGAELQSCRAAEVQRYRGSIGAKKQRCSGAGDCAELQRCRGAEVQRCRGSEVQRCRGAELQSCRAADAEVQMQSCRCKGCTCRGAEVLRCRGAEVQMCRGVVQWCNCAVVQVQRSTAGAPEVQR